MKDLTYIGPVYCVSCGKELKNLMPEVDNDYEMINGGSIGHIYAPYGSRYDTDIFQVAICDDCVDKLKKEKRVRIVGNYIFSETRDDDGKVIPGQGKSL